MQTSINLQEPFIYSFIPLLIVIVLIILLTFYFIKHRKKKVIEEKDIKVIPEKNVKNIPVIKSKYLKQLEEIEYKYENEKISLRQAFQLISQTIRMFVFEITDITTQNYSLMEIKKLNMPTLYELIKEYYEPEFATKSVGNFSSAIEKARGVIKKWN